LTPDGTDPIASARSVFKLYDKPQREWLKRGQMPEPVNR
jgi:hypothetical protein